MKIKLIIVLWIFISVHFCFGASPCSSPSEEQCEKLAEAIWKNPPSSIDITFNKKIFRKPMSEEKIRRMFEDSFTRINGPKDKMNSEQLRKFEKTVQMNAERILKEQQVGVNVRKRIRYVGNSQRIDRTTIGPKDDNQNNAVSETVAPEPNDAYDGTFIVTGQTGIRCYPAMKVMEISQRKKDQIESSDIADIANPPLLGLQWLLAEQDSFMGGAYTPSLEKIETLARTGRVGNTEVRICSEPNAVQTRDRIQISDVNNQTLNTIFVCNKNDYSRVYYIEVRMPPTGKPLYIKECNDFDAQGFPHNVSVTEYDLDGNLKKKEIYEIVDVNLNPTISDDVFAFRPPADYEIVQIAPDGTRTVIREKGGIEGAMHILLKAQKEKDVETLKGLLGHEIWQIRLRSLQVLESLSAQDTKGLKEAATILENDENPSVREQAGKILRRIKAMESGTSSSKQ
jgi:hypothetical protein